MADKKISALNSASALAGTEVLPIVQSGETKKLALNAITALGTITTGTWQGTAIADTYLATISTAGKVSNSATTAASANTASAIVARDASGNFSAGTITAALTGNASTATALQTARTINGVSFDGTGNITITANTPNALTAGTYLTSGGTFDGSVARTFAVDADSANTASKVVVRDGSGNFAAGTITAALTGNASTATALQTARTINGTSFDGTSNITITAAAGTLTGNTLASGVTASSLTSVGTLTSLSVSGTTTLNTVAYTWPAADGTNGYVLSTNGTGTLSWVAQSGGGGGGATLTIGSYLTGGSYNGSTAVTIAADATSANTASKLVARDGSGNFSAGAITASSIIVSGTTTLNTVAYTWPAADGSSSQVLTTNGSGTLSWSTVSGGGSGTTTYSLTAGSYLTGGTFNGSSAVTFAVDATSSNTASKVIARDSSGNFSAGTASLGSVTTTGNANFASDTLFVDSANSRVGIGTASPYATLTIRSQGTGNVRAVVGEQYDNTTAFSPFKFIGSRARGSVGSPTAVQTDDALSSYNGRGYKATAWSDTVGGLYIYAAENWTDTSTGTYITLRGTATGGTTVSEWARVTSGGLSLASSSAYKINNTDVLTSTTLGSGVTTSSLTSVGTLTNLTVTNTISGSINGNAATATALATARTINGVSFDGTGNITITANTTNALTAGSYLTSTGTFDGSAARTFAVDATDANTASKIVVRDASGNFSAGTITAALTGNASTATSLQTSRTINGVSFNGTANITVTADANTLTGTTLASGVTASSLTSVGTLSSLAVTGDLTVDTSTLKVDSTNNRVGIVTASPSHPLHVVGTSYLQQVIERATVSATAATGTINYDALTQAVLFYTSNASANWTLNLRGSSTVSMNTLLAVGDSMTLTFMVTQGTTPYYASAHQIDGSSVTPKWQGGTAPTAGNASGIDIYTYTVIKTAATPTYTVLASQTKFT